MPRRVLLPKGSARYVVAVEGSSLGLTPFLACKLAHVRVSVCPATP